MLKRWIAVLAALIIGGLTGALRAETQPELWLYSPMNLLPKENVGKLQELWSRAAKAGYTHVLLTDSKFAHMGDLPREYFEHCRQVKQIAADLHLEITPALFPVGYSNDLLFNDPNLAEGLPAKDTPFVVKGGEARIAAEAIPLERPAFKDDVVKIESGIATIHDNPENARLVYRLKTPRFRCYHVSVKIKTDGYTGHPGITPLAGERTLSHKSLDVKPTQDWAAYHIVFNSLDNDEVGLYFGVWGAAKGTLQWKDWKIEEVGLLNVLRRPGAPCLVTGDDGKPYVEGKDYEPISDPRMGNAPWAGEYEVWHEPPVIRTKLPDGTKLRVSWYHPAVIYDEQVCACISEPKTMQLLADQARRMKETWGTPGYMMSHDEFRVLGWDESCQKRHLTPGQMLAENVRECTNLLKTQQAYVWNDMFDPFHNAVKGPYYLVNGPWTDSWLGLDKDVVILNWNYGKRDESLKFFADRGHRQVICGYYDNDLSEWKNWLASAAKVKGVAGYMYTTWRNDYSQIEAFAKMAAQR